MCQYSGETGDRDRKAAGGRCESRKENDANWKIGLSGGNVDSGININYFLNEFPQLNYSEELGNFQFPGLFNYVLAHQQGFVTDSYCHYHSKKAESYLPPVSWQPHYY